MPHAKIIIRLHIRKFRLFSRRLRSGVYGAWLNGEKVRVMIFGAMLLSYGIELHIHQRQGAWRISLYQN